MVYMNEINKINNNYNLLKFNFFYKNEFKS